MDESPQLVIDVTYEQEGDLKIVSLIFQGEMTMNTTSALDQIFESIKAGKEPKFDKVILDLMGVTLLDGKVLDPLAALVKDILKTPEAIVVMHCPDIPTLPPVPGRIH